MKKNLYCSLKKVFNCTLCGIKKAFETPCHVCLQVQDSGLGPRPAELRWPEVRAVARGAHHQPQGRSVPASRAGAAGSHPEIHTHQVCVQCVCPLFVEPQTSPLHNAHDTQHIILQRAMFIITSLLNKAQLLWPRTGVSNSNTQWASWVKVQCGFNVYWKRIERTLVHILNLELTRPIEYFL